MSQKRTSSLLSPKEAGRAVVHRQAPVLIESLVALLVLALTACAPVPIGGFVAVAPPPVEVVTSAIASENEVTSDGPSWRPTRS